MWLKQEGKGDKGKSTGKFRSHGHFKKSVPMALSPCIYSFPKSNYFMHGYLQRAESSSYPKVLYLSGPWTVIQAYCVYVPPLLEYCSAVWSPHLKCLVVKMESVQRFFTKRLQGMWNKGYNDRLRLLNTHGLEYRRLYSDLVLCFELLSTFTACQCSH